MNDEVNFSAFELVRMTVSKTIVGFFTLSVEEVCVATFFVAS